MENKNKVVVSSLLILFSLFGLLLIIVKIIKQQEKPADSVKSIGESQELQKQPVSLCKKAEGETQPLYAKKELTFYFRDDNEMKELIKDRLSNYLAFQGFAKEKQDEIVNKIFSRFKAIPQDKIKKYTPEDTAIKDTEEDIVGENPSNIAYPFAPGESYYQVDMFPILGDSYYMKTLFGGKVDLKFLGLAPSPYLRDDKYVYNHECRMYTDVDLDSFVVLDERWAKDKNHVYRDLDIVEEIADPETFSLDSKSFGRDKLYQYSINSLFKVTKIMNVDSETSSLVLRNGEVEYYRDKYGMYFLRPSGKDAQGRFDANPENFQYIGNSSEVQYYIDKNSVYYYMPWHNDDPEIRPEGVYKLEGADYMSFKPLQNKTILDGSVVDSAIAFAKDANHVYYIDKIINGADPITYQSLWGGYGKDKDNFYYHQYQLTDYDKKSFEVINCGYSKDIRNVYYGLNVVSGADLNSFRVEMYCKVRDDNYTYENGVRI